MTGLTIFFVVVFGVFIYKAVVRPKKPVFVPPACEEKILEDHVQFYRDLSAGDKIAFKQRVDDFLSRTAITGVGTTVEDLDRMLVAAGAIIPIFSFPDWKYNNIDEVLLYPNTFNKAYETQGNDRNVLGMVGEGALNGQMILSKPSLLSSFANATDGHNTVIHEFVHLIDKADGTVDGVPEYLLAKPYLIPWVDLIHKTIAEMREKGSDINMYGATNDAEFFAVISEAFFEKPLLLEKNHPELYAMLAQMFQPKA